LPEKADVMKQDIAWRFRAQWSPVRVRKPSQNKKLESGFDSSGQARPSAPVSIRKSALSSAIFN
jgi:hypothetical protein